ncbi:hypothetical protein ACFU8F_15025, partial [Streptomyces griseus]|uniref:hypothetical protein n=1 Tax=Streptomyces griseus TaxID=1911 RepID=UPI003678F319
LRHSAPTSRARSPTVGPVPPRHAVEETDALASRVLPGVGVDVRRDRDLTVPEDLHDDTGRDAGGGEQGRAAVAGIVQPDDARPCGAGDRVSDRYGSRADVGTPKSRGELTHRQVP